MASLSDLQGVFSPSAPPSGFSLANLDLASTGNQAQADYGISKTLRNFRQFDLPNLVSSQAARGAFASGATRRKVGQLATGAQDNISNLLLSLAPDQAKLSMNALLAQTGIQL